MSKRREFILDTRWALQEHALATITELYSRVTAGDKEAQAVVASALAASRDMAASASGPGYEVRGGLAVIPFQGVVTKQATCMGSFFGGDAVTTDLISALAAADADPSVQRKLLVIDSPGGTVAGTAAAAEAVYRSNQKKPIVAYAEDQAASAAYWIGSQAGRFIGNSTAAVGSIGVYAVVPDTSRAFENRGVRMNVVKAGDGKAVGVNGTAVTPAQLADVQREIDALYEEFVAAVARGRGISMDRARELADGRVQTGKAAVAAGLLDAVQELPDTMDQQMAAAEADAAPLFANQKRAAADQAAPLSAASLSAELPPDNTTRSEVVAHLDAPKEVTMSDTTPTEAAAPPAAPTVPDGAATNAALQSLIQEEAQKLVAKNERERAVKAALDKHATKILPAHRGYAERLASADLEAFEAVMGAAKDVQPAAGGPYKPSKADASPAPAVFDPKDPIGAHLAHYDQKYLGAHQAALEHMQRTGETDYSAAVLAVTRRPAA